MKKIKNKTGQVSVFVIISTIIVLVLLFFILTGNIKIFNTPEDDIKEEITDIVKSCVEEFGKSGTFLLGFQGGYININEFISRNPDRHVDFGMKIPNWDTQVNDIPTRESMQTQLETYIELNAYSCILSNLNSLEDYVDIEVNDTLDVDVSINDETIVIDSDLLIKFNNKNSQNIIAVEDYLVTLENTRLGDLHSLAVEIYNLEASTYFIEDLVLEQIYSASDYSDTEYSMPSEGMAFRCSKTFWTIPQLKETLAKINNNNFKYLYLRGTYPIDDIYEINLDKKYGLDDNINYYKSNYIYSLFNTKPSFYNYKVDIMMPSTEITGRQGYLQRYPYRTFEVTPSNGQLVEPMEMEMDLGMQIPIPCIEIYHHLYTLDYDLIVKLTDYNDDAGNYFFQFPLRVLIQNNNPKQKPISILPDEQTTFNKDNYCNNESYQYPLIVFAKDKNTQEYLEDVNISYKCLAIECDLGLTKKPSYMGIKRTAAQPFFEGEFPYCHQGQLIAQKEGYYKSEIRINTDETLLEQNDAEYEELILTPVKKFTIDTSSFLMIFREDNTGYRVFNEEDGGVFVTFENEGIDYLTQGFWPTEKGFMDTFELLDDDNISYNISVIFVDKDNNLKGFLELKNHIPDIHSGNQIRFKIPATKNPIEENDYVDFYNYMNDVIQNDFLGYGLDFT